VSSSLSDETSWPPRTGSKRMNACLEWLEHEAAQIMRRDPPGNTGDIYLNDHGQPHIEAVLRHARQLISPDFVPTTTPEERALLYIAVWLHDLGLYVHPKGEDDTTWRTQHARRSAEHVLSLARTHGSGPVTPELARVLAAIVGAHSRSADITTVASFTYLPDCAEPSVRTRLLASLLRIADASDAGRGRTPIAVYRRWQENIPEASQRYWQAQTLVHGSEIDLKSRQVVLHLVDDVDVLHRGLRQLYLDLEDDLGLIPGDLLTSNGCPRLTAVFEKGGKYVSPGAEYAKSLERIDSRP
jgi:HD domain-containing protein